VNSTRVCSQLNPLNCQLRPLKDTGANRSASTSKQHKMQAHTHRLQLNPLDSQLRPLLGRFGFQLDAKAVHPGRDEVAMW